MEKAAFLLSCCFSIVVSVDQTISFGGTDEETSLGWGNEGSLTLNVKDNCKFNGTGYNGATEEITYKYSWENEDGSWSDFQMKLKKKKAGCCYSHWIVYMGEKDFELGTFILRNETMWCPEENKNTTGRLLEVSNAGRHLEIDKDYETFGLTLDIWNCRFDDTSGGWDEDAESLRYIYRMMNGNWIFDLRKQKAGCCYSHWDAFTYLEGSEGKKLGAYLGIFILRDEMLCPGGHARAGTSSLWMLAIGLLVAFWSK
jgi:hypothetical protein